MRKSFIAICAGLIVVLTTAQSYADVDACRRKCSAKYDNCVKKVKGKYEPLSSGDEKRVRKYKDAIHECVTEKGTCNDKCLKKWKGG